MSWPKQMWLSRNGRSCAESTESLPGEIAVLVYPADQAPEPAAWIGPIGQLMTAEIYRDWCADYPDEPGPKLWRPLYLAHPDAAQIRAARDTLRAEVAELRNCAVLSDQENDRINGLNARLRDELVGMEEQRNALRAEVSELRNCAVLSGQENDRLRTIQRETYEEAVRQASAMRADIDTLRELVREARSTMLWHGPSETWDERAEKALEGK